MLQPWDNKKEWLQALISDYNMAAWQLPQYKDVMDEGIASWKKTWMDTVCNQLLLGRNEINDFTNMMNGWDRWWQALSDMLQVYALPIPQTLKIKLHVTPLSLLLRKQVRQPLLSTTAFSLQPAATGAGRLRLLGTVWPLTPRNKHG